ncbi:MAG: TolC family protein [Pirellulales bacterium]|nr:TolC family protein [Pirellulales bacterium]
MRTLRNRRWVLPLVGWLIVAEGCRLRQPPPFKSCSDDCYATIATQVDYPEVTACSASEDCWSAAEPLTLANMGQFDYWNVSLQEAVQIALTQSQVIRDLGGAVLRTPAQAETFWDPAVVETDPRYGVDAALSAFDAQLTGSVFGEKNDRALNNEFFGGGTRLLQQDAAVLQGQIAKRAATGSQFALRHYVDYDSNNAPSNLFYSAWNTNVEAEMRQPLLQGGGTTFNRIAGVSGTPGFYNGVLIARVNTDVELVDFEAALRDLVSNVENAYWDLYFAYRDLDAKIAARNASLDTWRRINALFRSGRRGGEAEKEAQSREQYYRFQEDVQNALSGRLVGGTSVNNGSSGGTFRATGGVHVAERRLRMLIGLPPSDGRLIRPADEPLTAPIAFDWPEITRESLVRRAELRRQRWVVRRYELEQIASRNFLLPRLDAVGRYRWRGFGDDLLHSDSTGRGRFDNAYANLTSGDFQEWQLGMVLSMPLGFRQAATAVRNAELNLMRSRAILKEQEHLVLHDAAAAVAEFDRAVAVAQTTARRLDAARQQSSAVQAAYDADKAPLDLMLEAQRRLADAESRHYQSLAEYAIAIKNVHYAKGTLLDYDGVVLSESTWPAKAYADAAQRDALRGKPRPLNYASARAPIVSAGAYDQHPLGELPALEDSAGIAPIAPPTELPPTAAEPTTAGPIQPLSVGTIADPRINEASESPP